MTRRGATSLRTPLVASPRAESNSSTPICQSDETLAPRLSVQRGLGTNERPTLRPSHQSQLCASCRLCVDRH